MACYIWKIGKFAFVFAQSLNAPLVICYTAVICWDGKVGEVQWIKFVHSAVMQEEDFF